MQGRGFGDRENNSDILDGGGGDPSCKATAQTVRLAEAQYVK